MNDCRSALEAIGLDPQVGFLPYPSGLVPLVQARLLARSLREDGAPYVPFISK